VLGGIEIQSDLFNQRTDWGTIGCSLSFNDILFGITNYHVVFGRLDEEQAIQHVNRLLLFQPNKPNFGTEIGLVSEAFSQKLDYCIFRLKENPNISQAINRINGVVSGFANPLIGQKLAKVGAATNLTLGIVEARSLVDISKIIIRFAPDPRNESTKVSSAGDSGSVWFTESPGEPEKLKLVALHFGGDVVKNIAFANLFSSIIPSINQKIKS
jgi:hypothetical protein